MKLNRNLLAALLALVLLLGAIPMKASAAGTTVCGIGFVNASSLKCNNISLNYSFPERIANQLGVKFISLGASMSNPFTIASKDFKGRDPEVATGAQPVTSSYSFSLNVTF